MLQAEFKRRYLNYVPLNATARPQEAEEIPKRGPDAPLKLDWAGNLTTPVKDQGQCGSCWAFSATEQIESMAIRKGLLKPEKKSALSVQQIVSCDRNKDEGCNGGDTLTAYKYVHREGGLEMESEYPYTSGKHGKTGRCEKPKKHNLKIDINSVTTIGAGKRDEAKMLDYITAHGPLSICVDAEKWQSYKRGVIGRGCGHQLDHCVQLTGFDFTMKEFKQKAWIVRNSWNTDWGLKGYIAVAYGEDACGIATEATTVSVEVA